MLSAIYIWWCIWVEVVHANGDGSMLCSCIVSGLLSIYESKTYADKNRVCMSRGPGMPDSSQTTVRHCVVTTATITQPRSRRTQHALSLRPGTKETMGGCTSFTLNPIPPQGIQCGVAREGVYPGIYGSSSLQRPMPASGIDLILCTDSTQLFCTRLHSNSCA